jgi:elongation factor G
VADLTRIRNLGVVAHIDAGKTTVSERILYYSGVEHRMGEVHEGTAVMDWMDEERKRGITITAAATSVPWKDHAIHLIDTPGHVDFTVEVERCMRVLDGAVLVLNAVAGVQAQSETVHRQLARHGVPYLVFVNQYDRPGADFGAAIGSLEQRLGAPAVAIQYPVGAEREFRSVVDLVTGELVEFGEASLGREVTRGPVPAELADEVGVLRAELLERLAEEDEQVLDAVVEEREPDLAAVKRALRAATIAGRLVPVLVGAALRNVGIQTLLDAALDYLPSPADVPPVQGTCPLEGGAVERAADPDAPTAALAFKLVSDPHDDLTFVRVYSGKVRAGEKLYNPRVKRMERITRVLRMHAESRTSLEAAGPGEIVALTGLKLTGTGDTLCDRGAPITLEGLEFPEPVMNLAIEPASSAMRDKLRDALGRLRHEDPTFRVREDDDTGQWIISGMGELHLEVLIHRLEGDFGLDVVVGKPLVAYREAVRGPGSGSGRVDRALGGKDVFGAVDVELLPAEGDQAPEVTWDTDCAVPEGFRPSVEEALVLGAEVGPRFGYPLVGARLVARGGESVPARDAELAFAQAASLALREAMGQAGVDLLEPVMAFEITAPAEFMSGILAHLNSCRAQIGDLVVDGERRTVVGTAPLASLFGHSTTLRSLSQGRADFSLTPAGFRPVPEEELEARGLVWS